jgi:hypothetical protein
MSAEIISVRLIKGEEPAACLVLRCRHGDFVTTFGAFCFGGSRDIFVATTASPQIDRQSKFVVCGQMYMSAEKLPWCDDRRSHTIPDAITGKPWYCATGATFVAFPRKDVQLVGVLSWPLLCERWLEEHSKSPANPWLPGEVESMQQFTATRVPPDSILFDDL